MPGTNKKKDLFAAGFHLQRMAIFIIIIITFTGSLFLFWRQNTDAIRSSIEVETNLSSSLLANDIVTEVPPASIVSGEQNRKFFQELQFLEDKIENDNDIWIIDENGEIYNKNGVSETGSFFTEEEGNSLDASVLEIALEQGEYAGWIGRSGLILLRQEYCVVRPLYDGKLFLICINHANSVQAKQRQQFSMVSFAEALLVLVVIVLIANIIFRYRRQLVRLATTDELTNLSNRKSFHEEFTEFISREDPQDFSLFLLDIDFFKQINDNYGHAAGDHALRYLADRISEMVEASGGFAGRWGGDEFIGVLPQSAQQAYEALDKLCGTIAGAELKDGFRMSISAGVVFAEKETDLAKLSEKADLALYESKEHGRSQVNLYHTDMKASDSITTGVRKTAVPETTALEEASRISEGEERPVPVQKRENLKVRMSGYVREKLIKSTIMGVHWMAPFVAGGGILIALAFLFDAASVDLTLLSVSERANFGSITPIAALLKSIGGTTFNFMLPVFAGFLAYGIAGEGAFMAGFVGGYMVIDSNSGFVGAMAAGFVAGVIANEIQLFTRHLPRFVRKAAPIMIYPVFNLLLMQLISRWIITPVSSVVGRVFTGFLETLMSVSRVSAGAFSAMMMATDMGGIINKVAYYYGVDGILSGRTDIMAAVMIGGMVPPIGIFLSSVIFRSKFTEDEKERGLSTLFMGLSFITEGALPYVFTDMTRVIPSCMLGSAVAGLLSVVFGCTLPAPHGGLFVVPIMGHPIRYILALAAGSLITALTLGVWKKEHRGQMPV